MSTSSLSIPSNVCDLRDNDFFSFIDRFCGQDVMEYFQLLGIRSVPSLLGLDDIFSPLKEDYLELVDIKKKLGFHRSDGSYVLKVGIQYDVNKLINSLRNLLNFKSQMLFDNEIESSSMLTPNNFQQHSIPKCLINFDINLSNDSNSTDDIFLRNFLNNILSNISRPKNRQRYQEIILDFATCLFIYAGRNAYEFLRTNVPGAFPSLTTIQAKLVKEGFRSSEGEFIYNDLVKYMSTVNTKIAFCAEDCTSVQKKITYDSQSKTFVGFTLPLNANGMPQTKYFQTNCIEDLRQWFKEVDISNLLNLHMIQPIINHSQKISPCALAAYGTNGKFTSSDIIRRWFAIFEESLSRDIRIVGFATDADPRYLFAMRLACGFFATLRNSPIIHSYSELT